MDTANIANEGAKEQKAVTPKSAWASVERERAPWIRPGLIFGETIAPPNDQKSNNHFEDSEVLQERAEPLGTSVAFPINVGQDRPTGGITADKDGSGRGIAQ